MALGRRVITSARVVLRDDSALDVEAFDYVKDYEEKLFPWDALKFVPGETPTVFHIKPLTHRQRLRREGMTNLGERIDFTFRSGLVSVENYVMFDDHGNASELTPPDFEDIDGSKAVSSRWMRNVSLPRTHIEQVAYAVAAITEALAPLSRPSDMPSGDIAA